MERHSGSDLGARGQRPVTTRHIPGTDTRPPSAPYRSSPTFTAETLPKALQQEHRTKRGVWATVNVLEGALKYFRMDGSAPLILEPGRPALVYPDEPHFVELIGPVSVRIDFFDHLPEGVSAWTC